MVQWRKARLLVCHTSVLARTPRKRHASSATSTASCKLRQHMQAGMLGGQPDGCEITTQRYRTTCSCFRSTGTSQGPAQATKGAILGPSNSHDASAPMTIEPNPFQQGRLPSSRHAYYFPATTSPLGCCAAARCCGRCCADIICIDAGPASHAARPLPSYAGAAGSLGCGLCKAGTQCASGRCQRWVVLLASRGHAGAAGARHRANALTHHTPAAATACCHWQSHATGRPW